MTDFSTALALLKDGREIRRRGWNGKGMWLILVRAEDWEMNVGILQNMDHAPWIGMKTADDKFVPWLASQTDILAEDWETTT